MKRILIVLLAVAGPAFADPATIEAVEARQNGDSWRFDVTLSHPDTGWDHYADGWRVLDLSGEVLGTRILHHPHVNEQPFTRSLGGVVIPSGTQQVQIQARDNLEGWAGELVTLDLADPSYAR
ncbi:hypothetical protein [Cognatishimia activa]|uniref:hypothetical protein n=1 Tax=Cognatishimia activa TaxID=1715691 RepID=UPI0022325134|nr:hypothetical protein [Cognatishimia activa]UZD91060.1 hypothetical protein M0D42_00135 [Cognatishimia activa]